METLDKNLIMLLKITLEYNAEICKAAGLYASTFGYMKVNQQRKTLQQFRDARAEYLQKSRTLMNEILKDESQES